MSVDFAAWAVPDMPLELGGRTYSVRPPCVLDMRKLLACAVKAEVDLGVVKGPVPESVRAVLATIGPDEHPALGTHVYEQLVADGHHPTTIDRVAFYAVIYWTRGQKIADLYATALWTPRAPGAEEAPAPSPKALPTSRPPSGRRTGSGSRRGTTTTASRSSRTTASPPS